MSYSLIVGLGNPGKEYDFTRHNVGFLVIDAFANSLKLDWKSDKKHKSKYTKFTSGGSGLILAKPDTFMNESGQSVMLISHFYKIHPNNIIVIHDDIAFQVGDFRIHNREGTGGHNGVADILSKIGPGFTRFRVGIGTNPDKQIPLSDYVIGKFLPSELLIINKKIPEILEYVQLLLDKGIEHAMTLANRKKFL